MITPQQISDIYARRRVARGPDIARMQDVQQMVNGDIVIPLPELNRAERKMIPNRAKQGLNQFAMRIASAAPSLRCPPLKPGVDLSEKKARERRKAILGWWAFSKMNLKLRQRARYLQGYAESPVEVYWDLDKGVPCYEPLNPLYTYPGHMGGAGDLCPPDCIIESFHSFRWLEENYPLAAMTVYRGGQEKKDPDKLFTILKWCDEQESVMVVLGAKQEGYNPPPPGSMVVELEGSRYENRVGTCPIVYPKLICLDKMSGQFDELAGMYQAEGVLTALSIQAVRKGVFAEPWLVAADGVNTPEVVEIPQQTEGGTIPGKVKGGQLIWEQVNPQFATNQMIDRLAASQNETSGLTSELQGQAGTNIRTGARAQVLLSNVIDFPIQEGQEVLQESLQEENKKAIAFCKTYSGPKTFYVSWQGAQGLTSYDPKTTFETDQNLVTWPMAGSDLAGLVISGEQRVGAGTLSKRSFMEIDPMVEDAEMEHDRIIGERLEDAGLQALLQQVASGGMDPLHWARISQMVRTDKMELAEALQAADEEAKQKQAETVPQGAPEAQPGLAAPPVPQGGGAPSQQGLAQLLQSLRTPQTRVSPQEMAAG